MTSDATEAVSCSVLRSGNGAIRHLAESPVPFEWGEPTSPCTAQQTVFLTNAHCAAAATHFQGGIDSWDHMTNEVDPQDLYQHFLSWTPFDMFLVQVAKRMAMAAANQWYGKKFFGVNTQDTRFGGIHWVCNVIEILPIGGLPANHQFAPVAVAVPIGNRVAQVIFDDSDSQSDSESGGESNGECGSDSNGESLPFNSLVSHSNAHAIAGSLTFFASFLTSLQSALELVAFATIKSVWAASYIFAGHVALVNSAANVAARIAAFCKINDDIYEFASIARSRIFHLICHSFISSNV